MTLVDAAPVLVGKVRDAQQRLAEQETMVTGDPDALRAAARNLAESFDPLADVVDVLLEEPIVLGDGGHWRCPAARNFGVASVREAGKLDEAVAVLDQQAKGLEWIAGTLDFARQCMQVIRRDLDTAAQPVIDQVSAPVPVEVAQQADEAVTRLCGEALTAGGEVVDAVDQVLAAAAKQWQEAGASLVTLGALPPPRWAMPRRN